MTTCGILTNSPGDHSQLLAQEWLPQLEEQVMLSVLFRREFYEHADLNGSV